MSFITFQRQLLIMLLLTAGCSFLISGQEIPAGVRYKKATDEVNQKAKSMLEAALSAPSEVKAGDLFDAPGVCGPLLWDALKDAAGKELRDAKLIGLVINGPKPVMKEGRAILTPEQKSALWKIFIERIKASNSFNVRKAETNEIKYFWATIPFDIEEPFWVIDFGKTKVLVNFTTKNGIPKIFWIDIVGDLSKLK